ITMGLSIGLGGLGAPILGLIADTRGLTAMMLVIAAMPVLGLLLTLALPRKAGGVGGVGKGEHDSSRSKATL
ncbi:MAG: hypothetical protein ACRDSJ_09605, partial [Rubrobacteraceae bacterium]